MSMYYLRSWGFYENIRNDMTVRKSIHIWRSVFNEVSQDVMQLAVINIEGSWCCHYTKTTTKIF